MKLNTTHHIAGSATFRTPDGTEHALPVIRAELVDTPVSSTCEPITVSFPQSVTLRCTLSRQESRKLHALLNPRCLDALYLYRLRKRMHKN